MNDVSLNIEIISGFTGRVEVKLHVGADVLIFTSTTAHSLVDVIMETELKVIERAMLDDFRFYPGMEMLRGMERQYTTEGEA